MQGNIILNFHINFSFEGFETTVAFDREVNM